jgi:hypothetical protein
MMQRTKKLLRQSVKVWAPDGHEGLANLSPKRIILLSQPEGLLFRNFTGCHDDRRFVAAGILQNLSE